MAVLPELAGKIKSIYPCFYCYCTTFKPSCLWGFRHVLFKHVHTYTHSANHIRCGRPPSGIHPLSAAGQRLLGGCGAPGAVHRGRSAGGDGHRRCRHRRPAVHDQAALARRAVSPAAAADCGLLVHGLQCSALSVRGLYVIS